MMCPVCNKATIVVEYKNIELDYCLNCYGVWFDSDELELLLHCLDLDTPDLLLSSILGHADAETHEKLRRCPICRRKMKKTTIGEKPKILIDACIQKDGLWFDGGEVSQLVKELAKKKSVLKEAQQQVLAFLAETFKARA
ncbi:MAG TPA: zf-TFIIB domain-containing protein [Dehalococcoidia bacterium]|jgi:Zn-finger nucleic acid-binding protein